MNTKILAVLSLSVGFSASVFVRSALGDGESDSSTTNEARAPERTDDASVAPTFDPKLLAKLHELQVTRRDARKEGLKDAKSWEENRPQRAGAHRAQLAAVWGAVAGSIDGQARLRLHADHMARLNRMLDLAEQTNDAALAKRIGADIDRELTRNMQLMLQLQTAVGMR